MQEAQEIGDKYWKWIDPYNDCIDEGHDKTAQDFEKCLIEKGVDKTNAEIAAFKDISKITSLDFGVLKMATIEDLRKRFSFTKGSASLFDKYFANVDKDKVKKFKDLPEDGDYPDLPAEALKFLKTQGGEKDFNMNEFSELVFDFKAKDSNAVALLATKKKANSSSGSGNAGTTESHFSTYKMYYAIGGGVLVLAAIGGGVYFMKSKSATEL